MSILDRNVSWRGVTSEQRSRRGEGMSHTKVWGMTTPRGGNSKGPEAGMCLA